MASDPKDKKDLTGILDLQKLQAEDPNAAQLNESQDPFAVNELQPIEQVDEFQSIDQIGMIDHPEPAEETPAPVEDPFAVNADQFAAPTEQAAEPSAPAEDPFAVSADQNAVPAEDPFAVGTDPFAAPTEQAAEQPASTDDPFAVSADPFSAPAEPEPTPEIIAAAPSPSLNKIKNYSENRQGKTNLEVKIRYPFHLRINGAFGPFERDKLLLFITENPIGLSSSELDLQITSGRVFLPRISEYAAVKLVQDLRDSGLEFKLHPSDQDTDENTSSSASVTYSYEAMGSTATTGVSEIPILAQGSVQKPFQELDQVSIVQFVRTEVLEVESSPMIQEVIERMTEALKQKARLKGGNALFDLQKEILPLRLPSQYQISLRASVVKYE